MQDKQRRRRLTAEQKFEIYLECSAPNAPVGEILRRHGLYPSDLTKIRRQVKEGALRELGKNPWSKKSPIPYDQHERLLTEKQAQESALAQLTQEYLLLKKRVS